MEFKVTFMLYKVLSKLSNLALTNIHTFAVVGQRLLCLMGVCNDFCMLTLLQIEFFPRLEILFSVAVEV